MPKRSSLDRLRSQHTERADIDHVLETNGVKILETGNTERFPDVENPKGFDGLSETGKLVLKDLVSNCKFYLNGIIVQDPFEEDREKRRAFWDTIEKQFGKEQANLHERDKMRGNVITNVYSYFDWLVLQLDAANIHTEEAKAVRRWNNEMKELVDPKNYVGKSFGEKLEIVRQIENIARAFLRLATKE